MKKKLAYGLLFALVCLASCSFTSNKEENDKDKLLLEVIQYILKQGHFDPKTIDDNYSIQVYDHFIQGMDPMKRYFTQADIQEFKKFQYQLDDQFKAADIAFFDLVYQRLVERMAQTKPYVSESLTQPWDFDQAEFFESDYKALPYAQGAKELKERWRLQLKYMSLSSFIALQEAEKTKKEENPAYEVKSDSLLESEARNQTKTTMDEYFDFVEDLARKDYFAQYVNALVESFDPHTSYLAPEEKDRFDIDMSGKFEGIGARLSKRMDQTKITEIISGGPVWRDQALEVGDEILMVGQEGEEPVSIVGMRLDDAIKLIKGPKGTTVYLWVKKVDGTKKTV
ncbi:MAG TPA: tail-specific protease, partial [Flavobacteriaceae bacterium]|nr:tail-specific protease [Flavobacteriaceae bacterium]